MGAVKGERFFTKENAAEMGRKGREGQLRTQQRRKKLREALDVVGQQPVSKETAQILREFMNGESPMDETHTVAVAVAVYKEAEGGNMQAARLIYDNEGALDAIHDQKGLSEFAESLKGIAAQIEQKAKETE